MKERDSGESGLSDGWLTEQLITRRHLLKSAGMGAAGLAAGAILAACGGESGPSTSPGGSGGTKTARIGFAYIGPTTDNGWTFTHDEARKAMVDRLGNKVKTTFVENVPISAEASQTFEQLASSNDLVIANTEYANFLSDVAARHPDVHFLECDGHTFTDNLYPYYVAHHRPNYLLGVAGGLLSKSGKLGYVGAFPTATAFNDVNPMLLGARTVNPNATVQAVMISSFFDPQKATAATNALIDGGADYIFAVMDEPSFLQVCERRGVWGAAWNLDIRQFGPNAYVNSYLLQWAPFYIDQAEKTIDGTWKAEKQVHLLPVDLGKWGDKVPQDVQSKVAEAKSKIDGGFNPYTGPLTDNKGKERLPDGQTLNDVQAYSIDWAVEGVTGL
jgi:basic membrane protein A